MNAPYPPVLDEAYRSSTFWDLVVRRAEQTPGKVMVVDEQDRSLTFAEYRSSAEQVAAGLYALGVREGTVVTWQLPTSIEAMVLMAALSRLGAVQNPVLPILREREVTFITRQLRTQLLIVPGFWRGFDYPDMARAVALATGCRCYVSEPPAGRNGSASLALPVGDVATLPPPPAIPPVEHPVRWVYYTSGTTADPKGVKHTDRSAIATSVHLLCGLALGADDVTLLVSPITHVGGIMTLATQLLTAFRLVVMRAFDARETPRLAARHGLTVLRAAVPVARAFLDAQREHGSEPMFPGLRACQCGGASRPIELHHAIRRTFGLRGTLSSYGMTECPGVTAISPSDTSENIAETSGKLTPRAEMRVVGANGDPVPNGVEGELLVRGPQLFSGYVDETLNENAFDRDGFFRSGDLGTIDDGGYVRVSGRIKDVIIRNGENISALEIENVLSAHPDIVDVAVIGLPNERTGEHCCAVVQLAAGATTLTLAEVARFCTTAGIAKQKIPEQLELAEVPRNSMGKIDKKRLRERFGGVPAPTA
ncbi:MAG TPA: AMP-binding protein [Amycolatopsis sp.]|nr:AMP-binding protein [Amycolatopsis sp.]